MKRIGSERKEIAEILASERVNRGISQTQLAEKIGTKRSNISRMESGEQNMTIDTLLKVSEAMGLKFEFVLTDKN